MWPFNKSKVETRAGYSDALLDRLYAVAEGTGDADPLTGAAVEICAGIWSRTFAMADGGSPYFEPGVLSWIARSLCRHGEAILLVEPGEPLVPAVLVQIDGGPAESSWTYTIDHVGPGHTVQRRVQSHAVVHIRYATSAAAPWEGISPLGYARQTGTLSAGLERALGWEAASNVGYVLPAAVEPGANSEESDPLLPLRTALKDLKGRLAIVESMRSIANQVGAAPQQDWQPRRLGADPPSSLIELRYAIMASILAAHGVSPQLAGVTAATVAPAGAREALRQFLHTTLHPVARLIEAEANRKLGLSIAFSFDRLFASDLQGRARSFQSMVTAGMDVARAAALSGLMETPEEG